MRIYANCAEMHSEVKRDIHEMGVRVHRQTMQDKNVGDDPNYRTIELSPCVFSVLDGSDRDAMIVKLKLNLQWCDEDFKERISGVTEGIGHNPGQAYKLRHEWAEFLHDGIFAYTYSSRHARSTDDVSEARSLGWMTYLERVIYELRQRPDTNQAVLPIFDGATDLPRLGGRVRVPCSLHYQFLRRRGALEMIYVMRSSDFITHFAYDIWQAMEMQHFVAEQLDTNVGQFTFFTGSLHIYAKDADPGVF